MFPKISRLIITLTTNPLEKRILNTISQLNQILKCNTELNSNAIQDELNKLRDRLGANEESEKHSGENSQYMLLIFYILIKIPQRQFFGTKVEKDFSLLKAKLPGINVE